MQEATPRGLATPNSKRRRGHDSENLFAYPDCYYPYVGKAEYCQIYVSEEEKALQPCYGRRWLPLNQVLYVKKML